MTYRRLNRTLLMPIVVAAAVLCTNCYLVAAGAANAQRPNVLIFMADDQYKASIGCYGAQPSHTPNIDRLAREGLRFTQCFTPSSICTPNRAVFLSGMLPLRNGAHANHSGFFDGVKSLPNFMRELRYRACLVNKDGIRKPSDLYAWESRIEESNLPTPGATNPRSRRHRQTDFERVEAFLTADDARPFCLLHAARQPHTPWLGRLPNGLEGYDASNFYMDFEFGRYLRLLEQHGLADSTIVIYVNDNEANIPRSKYTLYDTAINVACIVRWPGHTPPGSTTEAMISFLDFLPTLVEIADGKPDPKWDGRSMLEVWMGRTDEHRRGLFLSYTGVTLGTNRRDTTPFPIRGYRTPRFKYIRNINHAIGHPKQSGLTFPPVELYDLQADPSERDNLAQRAEFQRVERELSAKVDHWMDVTNDRGIESELESLKRYPDVR